MSDDLALRWLAFPLLRAGVRVDVDVDVDVASAFPFTELIVNSQMLYALIHSTA